MTTYTHDPAPSDRAKSFIGWCAENISEWPEGYRSCARFAGSNNKWWKRNVEWRTHHSSLSHCYVVCTKRQWTEARQKLLAKAATA